MKNSLYRSILLIILLAVLAGCATVPDELEVDQNTSLISFDTVINSEDMPVGEKARWGGKIVSVENKKDVSEIEVVFFPENRTGKPQTNLASSGRFKVVVNGFVDPLVFEQGRLITVVGEVGQTHSGIIGEQSYDYPTVNAVGYYMWKESTRVDVDAFAFVPFGHFHGFHRNFFYPWYDPWHLRNHRIRYRIHKYNGHSQGARMGPEQRPSRAASSQSRQTARGVSSASSAVVSEK